MSVYLKAVHLVTVYLKALLYIASKATNELICTNTHPSWQKRMKKLSSLLALH